jgi:phosphoribosylformylglycinamidine synthase
LFGEAQGRVVVSVPKENIDDFESLLNIPFQKLGKVTSGEINIDNEDWGNIKDWNEKYNNAIGNHFKNYMPE